MQTVLGPLFVPAKISWADCSAVQDTGEAMDAAEDAADAVEHVADMAEDDDRPASQSSVGDVPIPKRGDRQLLTQSLPSSFELKPRQADLQMAVFPT